MPHSIAICGSNTVDSSRKQEILLNAECCGRLIAKNSCLLVCGGHGGVMQAACRGASEEGGISIGILPEDTKDYANPYVSYLLPTGLGVRRNTLIVDSADVVIAICGGWGTLNEISYACNTGKTVILLKGTEGIVDHLITSDFPLPKDHLLVARSAKEAVELALKRL